MSTLRRKKDDTNATQWLQAWESCVAGVAARQQAAAASSAEQVPAHACHSCEHCGTRAVHSTVSAMNRQTNVMMLTAELNTIVPCGAHRA